MKKFEDYIFDGDLKVKIYNGEHGLTAIIHDYEHSRSDMYDFEAKAAEIKVFCFYATSFSDSFFDAFLSSQYSCQMEVLQVGGFDRLEHREDIDYSRIIERLSQRKLPSLTACFLGIWEQDSNSGECYGWLGDVSALFKNAPNLEQIELFGFFICSEKCNLEQLISLQLDVTYWGTEKKFHQNDLNRLMNSNMPKLKELSIYIDQNGCQYEIPNSIFDFAKLNSIELDGAFSTAELHDVSMKFKQGDCKVYIG